MKRVRQQDISLSLQGYWNILFYLASFRQAMPVTVGMIFPGGNSYYVCPRCSLTMERKFMGFCDRCGQHLGWKGCKKARKVYPGQCDPGRTNLLGTQGGEGLFPPLLCFIAERMPEWVGGTVYPGAIYDLEGRNLYHFKVIELNSLGSRLPSYGIMASVLENGVCTYAVCIPDISRDKAFVDELAQRCNDGQLSPMHLLDVVLDALS